MAWWRSCCLGVAVLFVLGFNRGCPLPVQAKESWGYVDVREGAHMFWWLYTANNSSFENLPLIMWLQGGPGGSSCGFGNFEEIGPLDTDLKPRETSWVRAASVLFVDNPVGTGYSYTDSPDALTKDVAMVAADMMVLLRQFFSEKSEFQGIPFYIFSESYGGKMAAAISAELIKAIQKGSIKCNFAGVALGDSWISPLGSSSTVEKLGIIPKSVTWGGQAEAVFVNMAGDFMKPVIDIVDQLLAAGVNVTIYNGQLDLIVDTMGQEMWVKKLKWDGLQAFNQMKWTALEDPAAAKQTGAFFKIYKNFAFYWILKAGHMIPSDQAQMALRMMKMVTLQA
uniref:Carboxypeptidase n=1 Tax=Electrophorus electricus TaxID=8005 RepID=A0AAY5E7Y9_ELEEL